MKYQVKTPETYMSFTRSTGKCRVIHQGMPLCVDKETWLGIRLVLNQFNLLMASIAWDADNSRWIWLPRYDDPMFGSSWNNAVVPSSTTRYCEEVFDEADRKAFEHFEDGEHGRLEGFDEQSVEYFDRYIAGDR